MNQHPAPSTLSASGPGERDGGCTTKPSQSTFSVVLHHSQQWSLLVILGSHPLSLSRSIRMFKCSNPFGLPSNLVIWCNYELNGVSTSWLTAVIWHARSEWSSHGGLGIVTEPEAMSSLKNTVCKIWVDMTQWCRAGQIAIHTTPWRGPAPYVDMKGSFQANDPTQLDVGLISVSLIH